MQAEVRFYAELTDFLPPDGKSGSVVHIFDVPGSVKDVIESHGVPHTEVELVLVNGESVDFSHRVTDGDLVSVYPVFEALDVSPLVRLRPQPMRDTRFVLDGHLGKLARYLRLLGFDTRYTNDPTDAELVAVSVNEHRILLTRDVGLLKHGSVTHGCFVRATDSLDQVVEIVRRFHLSRRLAPFTRCMACNGPLTSVEKSAVAERLPPETRRHKEGFRVCQDCGKIYWRGSHQARLERIVAAARTAGT